MGPVDRRSFLLILALGGVSLAFLRAPERAGVPLDVIYYFLPG